MKALSIRAPWWWLILAIESPKDIENRTWKTTHRGPTLIHASTWYNARKIREDFRILFAPNSCLETAWFENESALRACGGFIMGQTNIVDCVTQSDSPWFFGPVGFKLEGSKMFDEADRRKVKGMLGFFEVPHG